MERALFSSLNGSATAVLAPEGGLKLSDLSSNKRWLVKVGEPMIAGLGDATVQGAGFALYSLNESNALIPRVNQFTAINSVCSSGQIPNWSCGSEASITKIGAYLPGAQIDLVVEVSELTSEGEVEFVVGNSSFKGSLPAGISAIALKFNNSNLEESLTIRSVSSSGSELTSKDQFVRVLSINEVPR
jgi:hypothetical protein